MNIALAITGASGSLYAKKFIEKALVLDINLYVIFSNTGKEVFEKENNISIQDFIKNLSTDKVEIIDNYNFHFKYASGSNKLDAFIILPCSMGSLSRISNSLSLDLIGRVADVQLKERRPLILCPRETPLNTIHIKNMLVLSECGAIIAPASPSFYLGFNTLEDVIDNYVERIINIAGIKELSKKYKW